MAAHGYRDQEQVPSHPLRVRQPIPTRSHRGLGAGADRVVQGDDATVRGRLPTAAAACVPADRRPPVQWAVLTALHRRRLQRPARAAGARAQKSGWWCVVCVRGMCVWGVCVCGGGATGTSTPDVNTFRERLIGRAVDPSPIVQPCPCFCSSGLHMSHHPDTLPPTPRPADGWAPGSGLHHNERAAGSLGAAEVVAENGDERKLVVN